LEEDNPFELESELVFCRGKRGREGVEEYRDEKRRRKGERVGGSWGEAKVESVNTRSVV
jgi:hypothetical protein